MDTRFNKVPVEIQTFEYIRDRVCDAVMDIDMDKVDAYTMESLMQIKKICDSYLGIEES